MMLANITSVAGVIGGSCLSGNIFSLIAIKLGAQEIYLGILNFAVIAPYIFGLFTLSAIETIGKKKILFSWFLVSSFLCIPFLFIENIINFYQPNTAAVLNILIVLILLRAITASLASTAWFPLLQDIIPVEETGRFFGKLRTSWQLANFIFLLAIGLYLGKEPTFKQFQGVFIIAVVAHFIRTYLVGQMTDARVYSPKKRKFDTVKRISEVITSQTFKNVGWYISAYAFSASMFAPFVIKMIKDFGYGDGLIVAATAMASLGAITTLNFWGYLTDKFGNRAVFSISTIGMVLVTLGWVFVHKGTFGIVLIFVLFFLSNAFISGNGIAQTRFFFNNLPSDKSHFIVILSTIPVFVMAFGPLLGGFFLKYTQSVNFTIFNFNINNYKLFFIINGLLFLIPHILRKKLRLPEETPTSQVIAMMTKPLKNIIQPFLRPPV